MPTRRYLSLCKRASMNLNGVRVERACGWSKLHWAETRVRRALRMAQNWLRKVRYEKNFKSQIPNPKQIPKSNSQMASLLACPFGAWGLGFVWDLGFGIWDL